MGFQAKNKQWRFIVIAIIPGIVSALLSWIILSAFGINIERNDSKNWLMLVILSFIVVTGFAYVILLFLYKGHGKKTRGKPNG